MNKDFEIAVTLNTDEANEKLEQLTAKAQGLAELFTSIAEQADRATKIMPPSTVVDAVYAMRHGCPPTTNFMRSISEMLRISLPGFEKMEWCIQRDDNGFPVALFPIVASSVQALYNKAGELLLQFWLPNGSTWTFAYTDVIHLRNDYNENDVFGTPPGPALQSVMEVIGTTDRSIINAVRNGAVIRWLLKFTSSGMRPEDIKKQTKDFADAFLDNNNSTGVAGTDVKADAVQLEPHDYVPNALQSQNNITRLYSFFNTNEKIVRSSFSENEWISYYEAQVEPDLLQIAAEHTRKLWNRRQRAFGNKLYLESSNLQYASMSTKLSLESMVDRGAMLPNEWRAVFGLAPVAGGDEPIRRLDTAPVKQTKSGGETE